MRALKRAAVVVAATCLLGTGTAQAWWVDGDVVCAGTTEGLAGVTLVFTQGQYSYMAETDVNGHYLFHIEPYMGQIGLWSVTLNGVPFGQVYIGGPPAYGVPYTIPPIEVGTQLGAVCEPPPPPECIELAGITEGTFCPPRPLGKPEKECAYFGLEPIAKDDSADGVAMIDADLALVKAGSCYYVNLRVTVGEELTGPISGQAFSHVTYCGCPPAQ